MLCANGEQLLQKFADETLVEEITQAAPGIYHVRGMGHSNAIVIEAEHSVMVIDPLETNARGEKLKALIRTKTPKPVKTIIFTHGHPDHCGGSAAFQDTVEEVIAFAPKRPVLGRSAAIRDILNKRTARQFGYQLSDAEVITQGLGKREGFTTGEGEYAILKPTTLYHEEKVVRNIDGVELHLVAAVGETDDQLFVWLPEHKILCCGDNFYACWPNIYALRGGQYRDASAWIDSLDLILSYDAEVLLPGHFGPVIGKNKIQETLSNYRDAIAYVLDATLAGMNQGLTADELAATIKLPEQYAKLPYLGEFYGTVAWTVRSIFSGYIGWFDGNPTNLNKGTSKRMAQELLQLIKDEDQLISRIQQLLQEKEPQLAAELCDVLLFSEASNKKAKQLKAECLLALAKMETSANGRHYYIACAKKLLEG